MGKETTMKLPSWTQITDDPATWPPNTMDYVLMKFLGDGWDDMECQSGCEFHYWLNNRGGKTKIQIWWRPLCYLDYPPEKDDE